jgi:hypothetical protein
MHARYYSYNLGRFTSIDPVGGEAGLSQSWNRYAYVRGNPVGAVDPGGKQGLDGGLIKVEHNIATGQRHSSRGTIEAAAVGQLVAKGLAVAEDWGDPFQVGSATGEAVAARGTKGEIALALAKDGVRLASAIAVVRSAVAGARKLVSAARSLGRSGSNSARNGIQAFVKKAKEFVGGDARAMHNEAGDLIIESKDGLRQIRFDLKNPSPHAEPHVHIVRFQRVRNGKEIDKNVRVFVRGQ